MGAIFGAAVGLAFYPAEHWFIFPLMVLAGAFGGWLWAMIPAILRTRFRTNEILVSLLLVYVAQSILSSMALGAPAQPRGRRLSRLAQPQPVAGGGEPGADRGHRHALGRGGGLHRGDRGLHPAAAPYPGLPDPAGGRGPARGALRGRGAEPAGRALPWHFGRAGGACGDVRGERDRRGRSASTSPRATASRRSSWPSSGGSTPSASCWRGF